MQFESTTIVGMYIIRQQPNEDMRGTFARAFCAEEFQEHGLRSQIIQSNVSYNRCQGTLRGMHFQRFPRADAKLLTCLAGSLYDVVIDLRPNSETFMRWYAHNLYGLDGVMIYVPEGCAHGFQTLEDDTTVFYQMFEAYDPALTAGVRWNDPAFSIYWPQVSQRIISERDDKFPDFVP